MARGTARAGRDCVVVLLPTITIFHSSPLFLFFLRHELAALPYTPSTAIIFFSLFILSLPDMPLLYTYIPRGRGTLARSLATHLPPILTPPSSHSHLIFFSSFIPLYRAFSSLILSRVSSLYRISLYLAATRPFILPFLQPRTLRRGVFHIHHVCEHETAAIFRAPTASALSNHKLSNSFSLSLAIYTNSTRPRLCFYCF